MTSAPQQTQNAEDPQRQRPSLWTTEFDWPFKTPPTREHLIAQGVAIDNIHLLALNESPLSPSPNVAEQLSKAVSFLNRYPDNVHTEMVKAVAEQLEISEERQIWGNGAGDLINRAVSIATLHQLGVVSPFPTFWGYERVYRLHAANVERVELRQDGSVDIEALLSSINTSTGIVTFATPGNPSGLSFTEEEIVAIARRTPNNALLMIDEVYHEFCVHEGGPDALEILRRERTSPWIVLRSFSKAYRLAGARIGYGLASDAQTAERIREQSLNFTVSSLSFAVAYAAWCDRDGLLEHLEQNRIEKEALSNGLSALGFETLPSAANFVSARLPIPVMEVLPQLRERGIICAQWNHPAFPNHIRIGVGTKESRVAVLEALESIMV